MKEILLVIGSDAVNKHGYKFPIDSLEDTLSRYWLVGVPNNIGHDIHRPAGWGYPVSLYLEPGLARLTGKTLIPQTENEQAEIYEAHRKHLSIQHQELCEQHEKYLRSLLNGHINNDDKCIYAECVAILGEDIAIKVFPKIFQYKDNDGLIPLKVILQYFELKGLGTFKAKNADFVLFAHPYFRKSLSRFNSLNKAFLENILNLRNRNDLDIKLRLDSDLIGYAPTYKPHLEFMYWRGPKFDDDIAKIPYGVTEYASDEYQRFYHGISKTQFWWKSDDSNRIFEAEELNEIPSLGIGKDDIGCRYVHAMIEKQSVLFSHFDGAIRIYNEKDMINRIQTDIKESGKKTNYQKLFRIDGKLGINEWKSLVSDYFQYNNLIIEYFKGDRESDVEPRILRNSLENTQKSLCSYGINKGMGIRLMLSYHPIDEESLGKKRELIILDSMTVGDMNFDMIEHDVIELKKALRRLGDDIQIPSDAKPVAFEDLYLYLSMIRHGRGYLPENLQNTVNAIKMLTEGILRKGTDHVLSFTLAWPTDTKEVRLSILGHTEDVHKWLVNFADKIPISDDKIGQWVENIGIWLNKSFTESKDKPNLWDLFKTTGVLLIQRQAPSQDIIAEPYLDEKSKTLMYELKIPCEKKQILDVIERGQIKLAQAFFVNETICSECGGDYKECSHSKFLDYDVYETFRNFEFAFPFWTDKQA